MTRKHIYNLAAVIQQTGAKNYLELQELGYDIEGYLEDRKMLLSQELCEIRTCLQALRDQTFTRQMPEIAIIPLAKDSSQNVTQTSTNEKQIIHNPINIFVGT